MDVVQKIKDLLKLALDESTTEDERKQATAGALRLVEKYLGTTRIEVIAAEIKKYISNPDFVEDIATRVEKAVSGAERVMGSVKKLSDLSRHVGVGERGEGRKRRYRGR